MPSAAAAAAVRSDDDHPLSMIGSSNDREIEEYGDDHDDDDDDLDLDTILPPILRLLELLLPPICRCNPTSSRG
jgi:hypothetical protein